MDSFLVDGPSIGFNPGCLIPSLQVFCSFGRSENVSASFWHFKCINYTCYIIFSSIYTYLSILMYIVQPLINIAATLTSGLSFAGARAGVCRSGDPISSVTFRDKHFATPDFFDWPLRLSSHTFPLHPLQILVL